MTRSALYLLGSPRIERDGAPLEVDTRKALALVAYLAVTGQPQTRDALAGLLWPEYGQARARAALRRTLSALQRARADGWLVADRETVGLAGGDELWVDLDEFHRRLAECRTHGPTQRRRFVRGAWGRSGRPPPSTGGTSWPDSACATAWSSTTGNSTSPRGCAAS